MRGIGIDTQAKVQRLRSMKVVRDNAVRRNSTLPNDVVLESIKTTKTGKDKVIFTTCWMGASSANLTPLQHLRRIALSIKTVENNIRLINALRDIQAENYGTEDFLKQRNHNLKVLKDASVYNKQTTPEDINPNKLSTSYQTRNISTTNVNRFSFTMGNTLLESIEICQDLMEDSKDKLDEQGLQVLAEISKKFEKIASVGKQLGENLMSGEMEINYVAKIINDINEKNYSSKSVLAT